MTKLDSQSLAFLREALLICLANSPGMEISLPMFRLQSRRMGHAGVDDDRLLAEIDFLVREGFAERTKEPLSPVNAGWMVTNAGRNYAEAKGLA